MDESLKTKIKWQVYNKKIKEIHNYSYTCFDFKFSIKSQDLQEQFAELICNDNTMPWDICNFFIKQNIKYSLHFKWCKRIGLKANLSLLKTVLYLKKKKLKFDIECWKNNYKIMHEIKKKIINNKERYDFILQLININKRIIYFIQCDSNIWWKPRRITEKFDKGYGASIGWLFCQIGKIKVNNIDK